jgi:hypothetical protein
MIPNIGALRHEYFARPEGYGWLGARPKCGMGCATPRQCGSREQRRRSIFSTTGSIPVEAAFCVQLVRDQRQSEAHTKGLFAAMQQLAVIERYDGAPATEQ